jgi:hypothetical protein
MFLYARSARVDTDRKRGIVSCSRGSPRSPSKASRPVPWTSRCRSAPACPPSPSSASPTRPWPSIALGVMAATGAVAQDVIESYCVLGELALDGSIATVAGALPAAIGAKALHKGLVCPASCGAEAAWAAADMPCRPAPAHQPLQGLADLAARARAGARRRGDARPEGHQGPGDSQARPGSGGGGGHHLLMIGPPGAGKSMLARRLPSILPSLAPAELEVSMIRSLAGDLAGGASAATGRSARRITPPAWRRWWAGARGRGRAKRRWRISARCFSTSCPSSIRRCSTRCASRLRPARP